MTSNSGTKILGPIEIRILEAIYTHRALFIDQLSTLLQVSPKHLSSKLGQLCKGKYLVRAYRQRGSHHQPYSFFMLEKQSVPILCQVLGQEQLHWKRTDNQSYYYGTHDEQVNTFAIKLLKDSPYQGQFFSEIKLTENFKGQQGQAIFRPDGLVIFEHQEHRLFAFIELERSLESESLFQAKISRYLDYHQHRFSDRFEAKDFLILILGNNQGHLKLLKKRIQKITNRPIFRFAIYQETLNHPVFSALWFGLNNDQPSNLF